MKDLTKGNEAKLLFNFALPMLIGNVFQQLYNTVDSMVVGNFLGEKALAAVGISGPIVFLLVALTMGVAMGPMILISQYYGAKDMDKVKRTIDTTYIAVFTISIVLSIVGIILCEPILELLNTPADVLPMAKGYLIIIMAGLAAMFGYNSISAVLRGLGDSKTPLYFLIIATVINTILDIVFVAVFHWGVEGAAWATVIAQAFSFIAGVVYLNKTHEFLKFNIKGMVFDRDIFKISLKIGLPSAVQQTLVATGMMALSSIVNLFGTNTIAAYAAAGRLDSFASMPAMNFAAAISTFVGQNMGAKKPERVKHGYPSGVYLVPEL
jgi:putative MATE family efflux protein